MSFDSLGKDLASTLAGVFGEAYRFHREDQFRYDDLSIVVRRNAEAYDTNGQMVVIEYLIRVAKKDFPRQPKRGDRFTRGADEYVIGKTLTDTETVWEFEASKC